ncbi:GntR family transcriptional regulator [Hoyosella rhizosphaerae]|nr:GntR family transcriptional regulator [Hoyosella rhizosphaerae]MBN4925335.1 GntR family transcriptional regulator [Hoyosella rhizosphaerae]
MLYSAADLVFDTVKECILTGELQGGELISEGDIAKRLEVSRTPVREGFLRLEAAGWMRLYPKKGALILPIADGEAEAVVEARYLVETHAVRRIVQSDSATERVVSELLDSVARLQALRHSNDTADFAAEDAAFHGIIVQAGTNPILADFYSTLRDKQRRMSALSLARNPRAVGADILNDHEELVDAVRRKDVEGFAEAIWLHMRSVHGLPPLPQPDRVRT